jgi:hypothetical protein
MTKILVVPDCQVKPGVNTDYLTQIGKYIADKQPDVIVHLGDFADMPSLSSYDVGKKAFEGRRYRDDIQSVVDAQIKLFTPVAELQYRQAANKKKQYNPRTVMCIGNHCNRINRAVENDPKLEGVLSIQDLQYEQFWDEVYPFLDVVVIEGIAFSHYFVTGVAGRPASSAAAQFRKTNMSSISGHQQGLQIHTGTRADGKMLTSIIAGSCYEHDEEYLGPQGNKHWRGFLMLHEVDDGQFDLMPVSLSYLERKYG